MNLTRSQLERVATLFRAFGEPMRLAIIQELKSSELSVSEIVSRRKDSTHVLYQIADPMVLDLCRTVCEKLNRDTAKPTKLKF